ncbi:hypothetical protein DSY14_13525 [Nocardiopsis sp. MG754419]|nr:hypothetical protein [Nocardiopsis sp. MG754419]
MEKLAKSKILLFRTYERFPENPNRKDRFLLGWGLTIPLGFAFFISLYLLYLGQVPQFIFAALFIISMFLVAVLPKLVLFSRMRKSGDFSD